MSMDKSNSSGPGRDFLCKAASLAVIGVACLINASRCSRVHCRFTGPFFILGALTSLGYGLGLLPLGPSGWCLICLGRIIGAIGLTFIRVLSLGPYRLGVSRSA